MLQGIHFKGPVTVQAHDDGPIHEFHAHDAIYNKTMTPIPAGGIAQGFLASVAPDGLVHHGSELYVTCEDVFGREYTASYKLRGGKDPMEHFPGMG